jgi:hypothetical protein
MARWGSMAVLVYACGLAICRFQSRRGQTGHVHCTGVRPIWRQDPPVDIQPDQLLPPPGAAREALRHAAEGCIAGGGVACSQFQRAVDRQFGHTESQGKEPAGRPEQGDGGTLAGRSAPVEIRQNMGPLVPFLSLPCLDSPHNGVKLNAIEPQGTNGLQGSCWPW